MVKFFVSLILVMLLSFAVCLYLPWWSIAVVAAVIAVLIPQKPGASFATGFVALFVLWSVFAFMVSISNHHLLAQKVSAVMFGGQHRFLLILLSGFIGALVAGFASLTGSYARRLVRK